MTYQRFCEVVEHAKNDKYSVVLVPLEVTLMQGMIKQYLQEYAGTIDPALLVVLHHMRRVLTDALRQMEFTEEECIELTSVEREGWDV